MYDDDEVEGSIMGYMPVGSVMGEEFAVVGLPRGMGRGKKAGRPRVMSMPGGGVAVMRKPDWRQRQVAPGVQAPSEGLVPIQFNPVEATAFSASVNFLTFTARSQVPFRGERLLVEVVRVGTSVANIRLIAQMFMGIGLQQANIQGFDLETVGKTDAFGVRMAMQPIEPGVDGNLLVRTTSAPTTTDTITAYITVMGRNVM